ncbi:MAG: LysM peptidoglycan-binding domain-containing protein [Bacillota bacterium]|nr:LysM peptidoglycan-binding domain-containing protein [Bacillota bacterium]
MISKLPKSFLIVISLLVFSFFGWGQVGQAASHRVAPGDTLWLISQRYNTTVAELTAANGLTGSEIYPGQLLNIPAKVHTVSSGDTMWLISQWYGVSLPALILANPGVSSTNIIPGQRINISVPAASVPASTPTSTPAPAPVPVSIPSLPSRDGSSTNSVNNYSQQDIDLLARLVHSESAGEPYAGRVAVAASVLNRVKSSIYPNTIQSVVYQIAYGYYQYSPVLDGRINLPANKTFYQAAIDAISGLDPSNGALGFYNPRKTSNQWVRQQTVTTVIGNHIFFR